MELLARPASGLACEASDEAISGCKPCGRCRETLPLDRFWRNKARPDGRYEWCKDCAKGYHGAARRRGYARRKASDPVGLWVRSACARVRRRAADLGVAFDLDEDHLLGSLPARCPALGLSLDYATERTLHDGSASLDRIRPDGGYTRENVVVVSWKANRIKNDASLRELGLVLDWMSGRKLAA